VRGSFTSSVINATKPSKLPAASVTGPMIFLHILQIGGLGRSCEQEFVGRGFSRDLGPIIAASPNRGIALVSPPFCRILEGKGRGGVTFTTTI